jgi:hypothetical protein
VAMWSTLTPSLKGRMGDRVGKVDAHCNRHASTGIAIKAGRLPRHRWNSVTNPMEIREDSRRAAASNGTGASRPDPNATRIDPAASESGAAASKRSTAPTSPPFQYLQGFDRP